jgi:hypothetical protein
LLVPFYQASFLKKDSFNHIVDKSAILDFSAVFFIATVYSSLAYFYALYATRCLRMLGLNLRLSAEFAQTLRAANH